MRDFSEELDKIFKMAGLTPYNSNLNDNLANQENEYPDYMVSSSTGPPGQNSNHFDGRHQVSAKVNKNSDRKTGLKPMRSR